MRTRGRDAQAHHARARRQVAEHRVSPTRISTRPCAARRSASSTARAKCAPPDRGCWSTSRSRTQFIEQARRADEEDGRRRSARSEDAARRDLVEERSSSACCSYVEIGKKEGATLVAGGSRADIGTGKGYFMQPTVFADVTPEMTIAREEIFGPVLAAIDFADVDEAIARANDSIYGLAAGVWTRDIKKAHYVASQAPGRHGLGQHLQRLRHGRAVRRLQAERLRPRDERARARALHAGQDRLGRSVGQAQASGIRHSH